MKEEVRKLLVREPFDPFRIKLINGDAHDVPYPMSAALLERTFFIAMNDGEWVEFRYSRIASLESLLQL
jgi:hypothetical protein